MHLRLFHDALASRARIVAHKLHEQEEGPSNEDLARAERHELGVEAAGALLRQEMQPDVERRHQPVTDAFTARDLRALYDLPSAEK